MANGLKPLSLDRGKGHFSKLLLFGHFKIVVAEWANDLIDDFLKRCGQVEPRLIDKEGRYIPYIPVIKSIAENNLEVTKEKIRSAVKEIQEKIRHYTFLFKKTKTIIPSPASFEDSKHKINIGDSGDEKHLYLISLYLENNPDVQQFNFITYDLKHLFHNRDAIRKWNTKINVITPDSKEKLC